MRRQRVRDMIDLEAALRAGDDVAIEDREHVVRDSLAEGRTLE